MHLITSIPDANPSDQKGILKTRKTAIKGGGGLTNEGLIFHYLCKLQKKK